MNRYGKGPTVGAPSKATASTTCQKCLKKGHYSYECKAVAQERPYVSRPSRTQQLLNPKLVPKLTSDVQDDLLRKKGIADEQLAKIEQERGRKRERQSEDREFGSSKRMRSASSSVSVSTISTRSRSQSPPRRSAPQKPASSLSHSPQQPNSSYRDRPSNTPRISDERKRRRDSVSSVDSYISEDGRPFGRASREFTDDRSTRRKFREESPPVRGRRAESHSPHRERRPLSNDRKRTNGGEQPRPNSGFHRVETVVPSRERSLSPFSKRLALTQSLG